MEEILLHQLLDRANDIFCQVGVGLIHEEQLAAALDLTPTVFRELFGSKSNLLYQATQRSMQRQRAEHDQLFANLATPVECLLALLHHSVQELRRSPHYDYHVMREHYPDSWELLQQHLYEYSSPLLTRLIQAGIQEGQFRADLDAPLIAHIMLAQFNLLIDEKFFPPDHTNQAEVYRNIYHHYVRGLCTDSGLRLASPLFGRI
ncbi:TetR/AcrR family transcriptional regulator [Hymenobacter mucosus]|uniref:Transcriptional regulator, TetR family n=1 Tax=Hymenobacter mucosus TaxID=1411120 RepID=A0A238WV88_9BACT|nr:TetR/AcrR family transcriptional regulator [Hymenobacter mucosus]SNR50328.1 transcriptional regulator, TetR family [Hymenobacter mucosus]